MLAWWRTLFGRSSPQPAPQPAPHAATVSESQFNALNDRFRDLKARYDAAQTDDDNRRHWAHADGMSAAAANSPHVRRMLRNRNRYEYDNGSYCNGIIRTRADDLVGTGPRLLILGPDENLNELVERRFMAWALASRFAEKLHTMDQTRCRDGEAFALMVTNLRLDHPVKLDLKLVEAEQFADPFGLEFPQAGRLDGVEYDELQQPIAYHVLREHPGDTLMRSPIAVDRIMARYVLHWYRCDRPGQLRGVPELTSALPLFPYLRRWTLATLAAAEYAASQSGVLETDAPLDPDTNVNSPFKSIQFDRAMFTELPAGYKLKQLAAEHPNQQYGDFKREICNEAGRPVRMPSNVVSADSSKHNFSSAKLDHFGYRGALTVDRNFAAINHLNRVFTEVVNEAQLVGDLPKTEILGLPRLWVWPGWPSMDKDQADQDDVRLRNGTLNRFIYWASQGLDHREMERQWLKEQAIYGPIAAPAKVTEVETLPTPATEGNDVQNPNKAAEAAASRVNGFFNGRVRA